MLVLGGVFDSLKAMSLLQLLLAFVAFMGYTLAQGGLIGPRGRQFAWSMAMLGAAGFAFESAEWTRATMLLAFGVGGMGLFVATVWLTSRALGFAHAASPLPGDPLLVEAEVPQPEAARVRTARASAPAHSI